MPPPSQESRKSVWPWAFFALGLCLVGLSASGILAAYAPAFLAKPSWLGALAALAVLPGLAYAWILGRGKPASLLRLPQSPYLLLLLTHAAVQLSGGLKSPLLAGYALLLVEISLFVPLAHAIALAL